MYDNNTPEYQLREGFNAFYDAASTDDEVKVLVKDAMKEYYGITNFYTPSDPQDSYNGFSTDV